MIHFREAHTIIHSVLSVTHKFLFYSWLRCMYYMSLGYIHANKADKIVDIHVWSKIQEVYPILKIVVDELEQHYEYKE